MRQSEPGCLQVFWGEVSSLTMTSLLLLNEEHLLWWDDCVDMLVYALHMHGHMDVSCVSFTLVTVMEDSSTSEINKKEEEQTTEDPDLTTGKCPHCI